MKIFIGDAYPDPTRDSSIIQIEIEIDRMDYEELSEKGRLFRDIDRELQHEFRKIRKDERRKGRERA